MSAENARGLHLPGAEKGPSLYFCFSAGKYTALSRICEFHSCEVPGPDDTVS